MLKKDENIAVQILYHFILRVEKTTTFELKVVRAFVHKYKNIQNLPNLQGYIFAFYKI